MNKNEISLKIEKYALDNRISLMDSCLVFCEEKGISFDDFSKLINDNLVEKIRQEAISERYRNVESNVSKRLL